MIGARRIVWLGLLGLLALGLRLWAALALPGDAGGLSAVSVLQCVAGTAVVLSVAWLGWTLLPHHPGLGWAAALAAAVYPPHVLAAASDDATLWAAMTPIVALAILFSPQWRPAKRWVVAAVAVALLAAAWICNNRLACGTLVCLEPPGKGTVPVSPSENWGGPLDRFLLGPVVQTLPIQRASRLAIVSWLVLAAVGGCVSLQWWRALWPTYAVVSAAALILPWTISAACLRTLVEPMTLLWAAAAVVPLLSRLRPRQRVRIYRPGEQARDPFDTAHTLPGPHFDVNVRRRAG